MITVLETAPTTTPVSLAEVKVHLRITDTAEDAKITGFINSAVEYIEHVTGRKLITQSWKMVCDDWPTDAELALPFGNLQSVTAITYKEQDGTTETFSADDYTVDADSVPGRVVIGYDKAWPTSTLFNVNPISVQFVTGYGTADDVPENLKHAIKMLVGHWVENLEATAQMGNGASIEKVPVSVDSLVWPYRLFTWGE